MRSSARLLLRFATLASTLLAAAPLLAAQPGGDAPPPLPASPDAPPALPAPAQPAQPTTPAPLQPASPAPTAPTAPATSPTAERSERRSDADADRPGGGASTGGDPRRDEGVRLALDLGFQRAIDGADDRLNAGTPTLLPLGVDVSFRQSASMMLGFHGFAALASRDDCIKVDSCRARAYGFGGHIEHPLGRGLSFAPWIRYGMGYEILYHGGAPLDPAGHVYRGAFDIIDFRIGADWVVSRDPDTKKSARLGAFLGFTGGLLVNQSGVSYANQTPGSTNPPKNLDNASNSGHLWFVMGLRATLDP